MFVTANSNIPLNIWESIIFFIFNLQWVEAENLEKDVQERDPIKYHEAWQKLCSCE